MEIRKININKILAIFLLSHIAIWTLIPAFSNENLPLDTIEALAWGSNLDWGFNKHPPLSAFVVDIFYQIFGNQDWVYYFLSQLFVITSFIIIWKFSESFFKNKIHSLLTILLLEGIYFYNYTSPEFNVYVCELPFWALTVFYCWKSIKKNDYSSWLLFGLFSGLGTLSHYLFIYLLFAIDVFIIYLILNKKTNFKFLISLVPFLLILMPHLIWLTENNYITITYAFHRTGLSEPNFLDHLIHPLIFLGKQIGILIPFFLMVLLLVKKIKINFNFNFKDKKLLFLFTINIIPIILIFLTSMFMGIKIRTMWMTPFYLFFGVLFIYIFKSKIKLSKFRSFFVVFLILFILSPATYLFVSISQTDKRTDYKGSAIASIVEKEWKNYTNNRLESVVGDEWHAGNLSYHLKSRPRWHDPSTSTLNIDSGFILVNPAIDCVSYEPVFKALTIETIYKDVCFIMYRNK